MSQKVKQVSGNLSALSGVKDFNVEIDLSKAKITDKNLTEKQYIDSRVKEITKDKGAKDAEEWVEDWERHKNEVMYRKFTEVLEKRGISGVKFSKDNSSAKYTLIVQVDWIYPGWYGGVMKQPSKLNTTLIFVETENRNKEVAKLTCTKAIGDIYPVGIPNTNNRISEAFGHTAAGLGKFMKKKVK